MDLLFGSFQEHAAIFFGSLSICTLYMKSKAKRYVNDFQILVDSTRIIHQLEARLTPSNERSVPLVPDTGDTRLYQRHVYFTALIDQVSFNLETDEKKTLRNMEGKKVLMECFKKY